MSEQKVWRALSALPDEWRVFHSVRWQSIRGGRQGDGEADFLLLHRSFGLVVLEIKGGGISIRDGQWYSENKEGVFRIKDPFAQAVASKYALLHHLKNLRPSIVNVPIAHAVAFPDVSIIEQIGLVGPRAIVVGSGDLMTCEDAVMRVVRHWGVKTELSRDEFERVSKLLAPTLVVRRTLRNDVDDAQKELLSLTQQQVGVLRSLRMVRKAVIYGGAGTGKTILAREKARQLAAEGLSVLLVCFNSVLAQRLRSELAGLDGVRATTFHSLCFEELRAAKQHIPANPDTEWWERTAALALYEAATTNGNVFDAVIVDEGQDFAPDWIEALLLITKEPDNCAFYMFADAHQELFCRGWKAPANWPSFPLDINCRNTVQVARRFEAIYGGSINTLGVVGPEPVFISADVHRLGVDIIQRTVSRLLMEERLSPTQIAIISDDWKLVTSLRETGVEEWVFCEPGKKGIIAETVARFKGLEADAVIVALTDSQLPDTADARAVLYVALSRARVFLLVIASNKLKKALEW